MTLRPLSYVIISLSFCLGAASTAVAQTPFDNIVCRIIDVNPSLKSAEAGETAAIEEFKAENALPGPEIEFDRLYNSVEHDENRWGIGITQEIPWPGALRGRSKVSAQMAVAAQLRGAVNRNEMELKVRQLLINYVALKKTHTLTHDIARSLDEMHTHYREAYEKGEATIIDVNKARIEAVRAMMEDKQDEDLFAAYEAEIKALAPGIDLTADLDALEEYPAPALQELDTYIAAYEASPERALALHEKELQKAAANLASANLWPSISVGFHHEFEDNTHFNGFSVGLSLPSWNFKAASRASAARSLEASFAAEAQKTEAVQGLRAEYIRAKSFKEQIAAFAPAVEGVNNMALLRRALDGGELTLLEYLQESAFFIQAIREYIRLNHDYALSLASLNRYSPAR